MEGQEKASCTSVHDIVTHLLRFMPLDAMSVR